MKLKYLKSSMFHLIFLVFFPLCLIAQDFYYGNQQKISLIKAQDRLVLQIQETDASIVQNNVHRFSSIQEMRPLRPQRGIYQFNLSTEASKDKAQTDLENSFTIIRSIPVYYRIDPVGERYEFIMFDEFVVKFNESVSPNDIYAFNDQYNVEILRSNQWNEYVLRVKENATLNTLEIANIYYSDPQTIWAHPNFMADIRLEQIDDPYFDEQWYLNNPGTPDVDIDALEAWEITTGSQDIIVAVIDAGVESHDDLPTSRLVQGYDPTGIGNGEPTSSAHNHGQAVAGIIAASHNNKGVRGVAGNVKIMPIQIFSTGTDAQDTADAIDWAWQNGADILSNSWGWGDNYFSNIASAINRALTEGRNDKGAMVVKSAG
ncbi:S8 family serine peptidase, partial [bacterium]|nr:S8 family serine peptidase [bacterium]